MKTFPRLLFLANLAFALLLGACSDSHPKLAKLGSDAVILAFGDSLTFGTGAAQEQSYPAILEKQIGRRVISAGIPGEISAAGLERLSVILEETKPELLILCHGGNDLLRRLDEKETANNIRAMVRLAKEKGVKVVLIGVPKPALRLSPADFYGEIAKEFRLPFEESALQQILSDNELKSDSIHPNARGYAKFTEAIVELLRKSGAV